MTASATHTYLIELHYRVECWMLLSFCIFMYASHESCNRDSLCSVHYSRLWYLL